MSASNIPSEQRTLSIAVPTYNRGHLLDEFFGRLTKVVNCHAFDVELLIGDNCSNDNTSEICQAWLPMLTELGLEVSYERHVRNIGVSRNILHLLDKSKGRYFMFLGDDDELYDDAFPKLLEILSAEPRPSAVIQSVNDSKQVLSISGFSAYHKARDYFYEYGNAWSAVIDTEAAQRAISKRDLSGALAMIVWPQTVFGFLAMKDLSARSIYFLDVEIGGNAHGIQNVTSKSYWVRSFRDLLTAAHLVNQYAPEYELKSKFVSFSSKGFTDHIIAIANATIFSNDADSQSIRRTLWSDFGLRGRAAASVLFAIDEAPWFVKWLWVLVFVAKHRALPHQALIQLKERQRVYRTLVKTAQSNKKRFGDWF